MKQMMEESFGSDRASEYFGDSKCGAEAFFDYLTW